MSGVLGGSVEKRSVAFGWGRVVSWVAKKVTKKALAKAGKGMTMQDGAFEVYGSIKGCYSDTAEGAACRKRMYEMDMAGHGSKL